MAIDNITDLTEIQASSLTDNDLIAVGTTSGWKKIKANSLGGGGAESDVVLCHLTLTDTTLAVTDMTAGEIFEAVDSGKRVVGLANVETDGYQSVDFTFVGSSGGVYVAYICLFNPNPVGWIYFMNTTSTASDYFSFDVTDPVT